MACRYSLIIPAYNERLLLPRLLDSVERAREQYRGEAERVEVIVADNGSSDDTAAIARQSGCAVATVEKRCIAAARNGGARIAEGEVLCFVDADCVVHPETFNVIEKGLTDRIVGGTTGVVPERWSLGLRVTYALLAPALWLYKMDGGVVFCRRFDFEAVGGYNEELLFAEDVDLLWALRHLGKERSPRQQLARLHGARTLTSTRKYDKHGQWHFMTSAVRHSILMLVRPQATEEFARRYWYDDR
jgi:glycosyltransferase involved in cell wall biosynthesis